MGQNTKKKLTIANLCKEAAAFAQVESTTYEPLLYGVTDGKAVGTYLEQKFQKYLGTLYSYDKGNSAKGIDFPSLGVDIKVTSIKQPQSSCPFKSARQKIYGLGYSLLVFVYDKKDDTKKKAARLNILHTIFVDADRTADYQTSSSLQHIVGNKGNVDDIIAYLIDRNLPIDDIQIRDLAKEILAKPPATGYLTISNALQWRLQYTRVIEQAGTVKGVVRVT